MNVSKNRSLRTLAWSVIAGVLAVGVVVADPADHQMRLDPMELGVSSGNIQHIDGNSCCGGTAGALVQNANGEHFILSNNHVFGG